MKVELWCKDVVWNKRIVEVDAKSLEEIKGMTSGEFEDKITKWVDITDSESDSESDEWDTDNAEEVL